MNLLRWLIFWWNILLKQRHLPREMCWKILAIWSISYNMLMFCRKNVNFTINLEKTEEGFIIAEKLKKLSRKFSSAWECFNFWRECLFLIESGTSNALNLKKELKICISKLNHAGKKGSFMLEATSNLFKIFSTICLGKKTRKGRRKDKLQLMFFKKKSRKDFSNCLRMLKSLKILRKGKEKRWKGEDKELFNWLRRDRHRWIVPGKIFKQRNNFKTKRLKRELPSKLQP